MELESVTKIYAPSPRRALDGISLSVDEGEFVALLGPSGSGKTTALRCIAGLEAVSGGEIRLGGRVVSTPGRSVSPAERNIGMVFQSYALWPHMTVFDNVAYALKVQRVRTADIRDRVQKMLDMLGLAGLDLSYPHQLSGGQQQRVALARALVAEPALILFDEPLSNLDARLRESMRVLIRDLTRRLGVAGVYVTHDRLDALVMADRVVVMNAGAVVQEGTPRDLYARPSNAFVARFLGDVNVYPGTVVSHAEHVGLSLDGGLGDLTTLASHQPIAAIGDRVQVVIRPNQVRLQPTAASAENHLRGTLDSVTFLGEVWRSQVRLGEATAPTMLEVLTMDAPATAVGEPVDVYVSYASVGVLPWDDEVDA